MDNFILKRKVRRFKQADNERPKIYVRPATYTTLSEWALETGLGLAEVTEMAVNYAAKHLVRDCEE